MSKTYFTSDWHLGHRNILKYRPQFKTIEEHDNTFINNFNKVVRKRDTVYFLGDICFTEESLQQIKNLNFCRKILYLGNHDFKDTRKLLEVFDEVYAFRSFKRYWLSHAPIHTQELRNRIGNIHGHLHASILDDPEKRYFDVSPEKRNFEIVDFEDVKVYFADHIKKADQLETQRRINHGN
jgi:calcineurin-like phosphoesterase family protein